jgi:hypothetical protein
MLYVSIGRVKTQNRRGDAGIFGQGAIGGQSRTSQIVVIALNRLTRADLTVGHSVSYSPSVGQDLA